MDCATDRDCEGDMTCGPVKKKCKKSCVTDQDCPVPYTCEEFFSFSGCRKPCTDDRDCKEDFICKAVDYGSFCFWSPPTTTTATTTARRLTDHDLPECTVKVELALLLEVGPACREAYDAIKDYPINLEHECYLMTQNCSDVDLAALGFSRKPGSECLGAAWTFADEPCETWKPEDLPICGSKPGNDDCPDAFYCKGGLCEACAAVHFGPGTCTDPSAAPGPSASGARKACSGRWSSAATRARTVTRFLP
jgi:hypothetical protein